MADLRFGTFLAPTMLPVYQAITDEVGARLGMSTELVVETGYENCRNDLNDVCFPEFHEAVRDVLVGLHRDPEFKRRVLGRGMVERFVAVGPGAYDDIRRMVDACEAAGFTKLR